MAEPTPTPPNPQPPKAPRNPGSINQAWLDELNNSGQIVASAQKPAYLARFTAGGIAAAKLAAFSADIEAAKKLAGIATQATTGKRVITRTESDLMDSLIAAIQGIQKRAKQKYAATNPAMLADYAVGQPYHDSRTLLEQAAANILGKLATDTLPGIDAARIAALQAAADAYKNVQTAQTGGQSGATTDRAKLEAAVNAIAVSRREIQYAADDQWPHTDPLNAGIRVEFQLPANRALK